MSESIAPLLQSSEELGDVSVALIHKVIPVGHTEEDLVEPIQAHPTDEYRRNKSSLTESGSPIVACRSNRSRRVSK